MENFHVCAFAPTSTSLPSRTTSHRVCHRRVSIVCRENADSAKNNFALKVSRRTFGKLATAVIAAAAFPSSARSISGLQAFPLFAPLSNDYYFMRAGESASLARGEMRTNPVEKISIPVHGLTPRGVDQVLAAAKTLQQAEVGQLAWIWASQHESCQETADLLAYELEIRREQIVPEYAYLDSRGVGAMEGSLYKDVRNSLAKMDSTDINWRLPPGEDGTPTESVADIFVRVRQLLSKLETQYNGDTIVVVAPDSDLLSVLECALRNEPLSEHAKFEYAPGEVRKVTAVVVPRLKTRLS